MSRTCLGCGRVTRHGSRCALCNPKPTAQARKLDRAHRTQAVQHWIASIGGWCPGWNRDGHVVDPASLTADHDPPGVPVTDWRDLSVLCRPCNSRKKDGVR